MGAHCSVFMPWKEKRSMYSTPSSDRERSSVSLNSSGVANGETFVCRMRSSRLTPLSKSWRRASPYCSSEQP